MNRLSLLFILLLVVPALKSQDMVSKIDIEVGNYLYDTIVLGYHYGGAQYVQDTLIKNNAGVFTYQSDDPLPAGIYLLLLKPSNSYVEILIDEDQDFSIKFDSKNAIETFTSEGTNLNTLFYSYLQWISPRQKRSRELAQLLKGDSISDEQKNEISSERYTIDSLVRDYQQQVIADHPESMASALLKININPTIPKYEGTPVEVDLARFKFYKSHYFDNLLLSDPRLIRTPLLLSRLNYYLDNLTTQQPDSIIKSVDYMLGDMSKNEESFKYGLPFLLNKYAKSNIVGFDGVYVHLIDTYYAKGLAPWTDKKTMESLVKGAKKLKPILVGKIAPNFVSYTLSGEAVDMHEIDADYTVLFFWAPDCAHCKKATPTLLSFHDKYKDRGVQILATCTKSGTKEDNCWSMVTEKGMERMLNTTDRQALSRFQVKYNIKTTPQIFILDRDKKILVKKIGVEQLDNVMEHLLEVDNNESK